jgi:hypothetical protein
MFTERLTKIPRNVSPAESRMWSLPQLAQCALQRGMPRTAKCFDNPEIETVQAAQRDRGKVPQLRGTVLS